MTNYPLRWECAAISLRLVRCYGYAAFDATTVMVPCIPG